MMYRPRFVVAALGSAGDVYPFLEIAACIKDLGYDVSLISFGNLEEIARSRGLDFVEFGEFDKIESVFQRAGIQSVFCSSRTIWSKVYLKNIRTIRSHVDEIDDELDVVIICTNGTSIIADLSRSCRNSVKIVSAFVSPHAIFSNDDEKASGNCGILSPLLLNFRRTVRSILSILRGELFVNSTYNKERLALGLDSISNVGVHSQECPDISVTLFPEWFGPAKADWPHPLISGDFVASADTSPRELGPEISEFLALGSAPILFTAGSGNFKCGAFFETALAASARLGARAIFVHRNRNELPADLPVSVIWQDFLPDGAFTALLHRVSTIVHHGGIGTSAAAMRAGIPQVFTPYTSEQLDNALRFQAHGTGVCIPAKKLEIANLCAAVGLSRAAGSGGVRASEFASVSDDRSGAPKVVGLILERLGLRSPTQAVV